MESFKENIATMRNISFGEGYKKIYTVNIPYGYIDSTDKGYSFASFDLRVVACSSEHKTGKTIDSNYTIFIKYTDNLVIDMYYNGFDGLNYQNNNNYKPMDKILFVANKNVLDTDQYTKTKVLTIDIYFACDYKLQYGYTMDNLVTTGRVSVEDVLYVPNLTDLPESNITFKYNIFNKTTNNTVVEYTQNKDCYINSKFDIITNYATMERTLEGYMCLKQDINDFPIMLTWITSIDTNKTYKNLTEIYRTIPVLLKNGSLINGLIVIDSSSRLWLRRLDKDNVVPNDIDKILFNGVKYIVSKY